MLESCLIFSVGERELQVIQRNEEQIYAMQ